MYDKYTARLRFFISCNFIDFSPFYSASNIVLDSIKTAIICAFSAFLQNPKIRVRKVH